MRGARLGRRDLRLGLGPAKRHVPLGVDLDLAGLGLADGSLLVCCRLRHPGIPLATRRLLLADELHVARLVTDRLDRERIDLEPGRREVALGGVLDGLLELLPVEVQLLDRERADDRPEGALQHILDDRIDLLLLGLEEPFGGVPDRLVVGADLERRDALDGDLDALAGDGVGEGDVDLPGGQLELADLVEQRQDDDALAADDLEARLAAAERRRPTGADQRLVRAGDFVAAAEVGEQQGDDDDRDEDDEDATVDPQEVKHPWSLQFRPRPTWPPAARRAGRSRRCRSR